MKALKSVLVIGLFVTCTGIVQAQSAQQDVVAAATRALDPRGEIQRKINEKSTSPVTIIVKYAPLSASPKIRSKSLTVDLSMTLQALGASPLKPFMTSSISQSSTGSLSATSTGGGSSLGDSTYERLSKVNARFPIRAARASKYVVMPDLSTFYTVTIPAGSNVTNALNEIREAAGVQYAYRSVEYKTSQAIPGDSGDNDSGILSQEAGVLAIQAPTAWSRTTGNGIIVAVNDTGVQYNHNYLSRHMWKNPTELAGNCSDDDNNGFVDDEHGVDFTESSRVFIPEGCPLSSGITVYSHQPFDCNGHGTHVAGTIAGVAPDAKIMPIKGLSDGGVGSSEALAQGIIYATDNGADVINNSWGSSDVYRDPVMVEAIRYAAAAGVINVFAAGNSNIDMALSSPANMDEVIAVGAIDENNQRAPFSNYGARIDVMAPGVNVESTFPDGCDATEADPIYGAVPVASSDVSTLSGTSMASPHVAGAVALLLAYNPALRLDEVRSILRASADDLGAPGFDPYYGAGRLNIARALEIQTAPQLSMRLSSETLMRSQRGALPPFKVFGTVAGKALRSYEVGVRSWNSTSDNWKIIGRGNGSIRNGLLAQSALDTLADGRYLVRVSAVDKNGVRFDQVRSLLIMPQSKILDAVPGFVNDTATPASFNQDGAVWSIDGFYPPESFADPYLQRDRGTVFRMVAKTDSSTLNIKLGSGDEVYEGPVLLGAWGKSSGYSGASLNTGILPDMMRVADLGTIANGAFFDADERNISNSLPAVYTIGQTVNGALWAQDIGLSNIENKIVRYSLNQTRLESGEIVEAPVKEVLVNSIRNSYLIYPQFVKNQGGESSILLAIEVSVVPHADNTMRLVSYDTSASNISKTRKVVWEQDPRGLFVQVSAFGNLACFSEIPDKGDEYNTKGSTMVVDIRSGKAISLPGGGKCAIPRSNFVTAIGYTSAGKQLNGYDLDTKKSGAVPLSVAMDPRSLTITDDKNLSWKEYFEGGTWLLQLDVDSFRRDVNGFAVPTPSPTPNVTVR